jgi:hypothetical protein
LGGSEQLSRGPQLPALEVSILMDCNEEWEIHVKMSIRRFVICLTAILRLLDIKKIIEMGME